MPKSRDELPRLVQENHLSTTYYHSVGKKHKKALFGSCRARGPLDIALKALLPVRKCVKPESCIWLIPRWTKP